jgi:uncharacterized protein YukE
VIEQSASIKSLAEALSKTQAAVEGAVKGKVNPAFKSKYADLSSVWEACREALTENGLSVLQSPGEVAEGRMAMTTQLMHASGEWIRGTLTIPLGKVDAQAYGSATTYARRYALAAFVGVSPEDDDGAAATKAKPTAATGRQDPDSLAQKKRDGLMETWNAEIDACADMIELRQWWKDHAAEIKDLPEIWQDAVGDRKEARKVELEAADGASELDAGFKGAVG